MMFVAVFELGSVLCGVAQSSNMLIVGRAVAGIGGSGIQNGALTIIAACVPSGEERRYDQFSLILQKVTDVLGFAAYLGFMMGCKISLNPR